MGQYKANSTDSRNFSLTFDDQNLGELIYKKWYSFEAEIILFDGATYQLEPVGFWNTTIELKDDTQTLLEFTMGWKGIIIKTFFDSKEDTFLLALSGLLSSKFVLIDTNKTELMAAETAFKWSKLSFDYTIETTQQFDNFNNKALLLLTIVHCINYYMTVIGAAA